MNSENILSDIDKKILLGNQLGVFNDQLGQKLLQLYGNGILDSWAIGQINKRVDKQLRKEAFANLPFKQPQLHSGEFIVGADENTHRPIRTFIQYLNAGSLLVANTGSGKTTMVSFYATQIVHQIKGMWLVDLRKKEFRLLMPSFAQRGIDLTVVRSRKFKINPLQVPLKVNPYEYASTIADVLVKVLNLPPRASVLLSSTIIKLYKEFDVLNGSTKYPTLFHLFEAVRVNKNANSQARQAILDNLEAILLAFGTEMLGYYRGWPVHELAKRHMVFELTGLPETGKDLVLNYIVVAEFISRVSRGISNQGMDLWMSLDESQKLFSQRKESTGYGGNSITDLAGLVRGTGTGLFVSVLTPDDLSNKIPSITSTKIMGRCGSISEYQAAGQFMGLNKDQIIWCAHHMLPGMFVGQLGDGPWRYPFLFRVPKMKKLQVVTDVEADESLKSLDCLKVEPVEFSNWSAVENITIKDEGTYSKENSHQLTDSEFRYLKAIVDKPMQASSTYPKLAGVSSKTAGKFRKTFVSKGFIKEHKLETGGRGRNTILLEVLTAGIKAVNAYKEGRL